MAREGEDMYVEHRRVLESFAIDGYPLIPGDGLALFEDLLHVSMQPALRLRSGEVPEGGSRVANPVFDEGIGKDYEGRSEKRERKEPNHFVCRSSEARGLYWHGGTRSAGSQGGQGGLITCYGARLLVTVTL